MHNPADPVFSVTALLHQLIATPAATLPELEAFSGLAPHSCLLALCRLEDDGRVVGGGPRACRVTGYTLRTWSLAARKPLLLRPITGFPVI